MNDPIVDEVRKVRDEYAARFNYDLDAMVRDLREQQARSGRTFVRYGHAAKETSAGAPEESAETLPRDNARPEGINTNVPPQQNVSAVG